MVHITEEKVYNGQLCKYIYSDETFLGHCRKEKDGIKIHLNKRKLNIGELKETINAIEKCY